VPTLAAIGPKVSSPPEGDIRFAFARVCGTYTWGGNRTFVARANGPTVRAETGHYGVRLRYSLQQDWRKVAISGCPHRA